MITPKLNYDVGDTAWISLGDDELVESRVVAVFQPRDQPCAFYVLDVNNDHAIHYEVRDALLMSPTAAGPLPIWTPP